MMSVINVRDDFSVTPGGRLKSKGPHSGESFRGLLAKAFQNNEDGRVVVELDGTRGYGASFLEESFGGLVRNKIVPYDKIKERLELKSSKDYLKDEIWLYIEEASKSC